MTLFSIVGGRHSNMLSKNTVKLREAIKPTGFRHLCNGDIRVDKQCLNISNPCHLNIVGYRESGYLFESVGKVAGTNAEMLCEEVK